MIAVKEFHVNRIAANLDIIDSGLSDIIATAAQGGNVLSAALKLVEAVAGAKAILAMQEQAQFEAEIEEMYRRHLDRQALVDDALESDIRFWRENAYVAGAVKLEAADMLPV